MDDLLICSLCDQVLVLPVVRTCCAHSLCYGCNHLAHADDNPTCVFCGDETGSFVTHCVLDTISQRKTISQDPKIEIAPRVKLMLDMKTMVDKKMTYEELLSYWGTPSTDVPKLLKTMQTYETRVARNAMRQRSRIASLQSRSADAQ